MDPKGLTSRTQRGENMKKIILFTLLLVMSVTLFFAEAITPKELLPDFEITVEKLYNNADDVKIELSVNLNQWFKLNLKSNPGSTGYDWYVVKEYDKKIISLVSKSFAAPGNTEGIIGAGGLTICLFHALKEGTTSFTLGYMRSWETDVDPIKTATVAVTVIK